MIYFLFFFLFNTSFSVNDLIDIYFCVRPMESMTYIKFKFQKRQNGYEEKLQRRIILTKFNERQK